MYVRVDIRIVLHELAFGVDQKRLPLRECHPEHLRLGTVGVRGLALDVREQREGKTVLLGEGLMRCDVVETHAEDLRIHLLEREDIVAELAGLGRATRSLVLRIEIQDDPLVAVILEGMQLSVLIRQFEFGRGLANLRRGRKCRGAQRERK